MESDTSDLVIEKAIYEKDDYCGPFFICCDHGCSHVPSEHGRAHSCCIDGAGLDSGRNAAWTNCLSQIRNADVLFAWIDSEDCFGTLAEIGYAYANGILITIATNKMNDNLWFIYKMAGLEIIVQENAVDGFHETYRNLDTLIIP